VLGLFVVASMGGFSDNASKYEQFDIVERWGTVHFIWSGKSTLVLDLWTAVGCVV